MKNIEEKSHCKKYKCRGSLNSDANSKYRMVKSESTTRPLKSALKATSSMSEDTNLHSGRKPGFLSPSLSVSTLCSVSSPTNAQPAHTVTATVPGWGSGGQDIPRKKVTFNTVIQSYSVTGDLYFEKVTLFSPGSSQFFRSRSKNHYRPRRFSRSPAATPGTTCSVLRKPAATPGTPAETSPVTPRAEGTPTETSPVTQRTEG